MNGNIFPELKLFRRHFVQIICHIGIVVFKIGSVSKYFIIK